MVYGTALRLLRRHVTDRAHDYPGRGQWLPHYCGWCISLHPGRPGLFGELCQAKVEDLRVAIARDHHVVGFRSRCTMPAACALARPSATCCR